MKKLLAVLTAVVVLSCGDAGGGSTQATSMPVHADIAGAKALFVSSRSGLARQAVEDNTLFMIDADGEIQPVAFTDAQGGSVNLTVDGDVRNLARTFLTFDFALDGQTRAVENEHAALVELDTGTIYDFTGKYAAAAIGKKEILYENIIEVSSNWRYAQPDGTLYYWNMNTANAIPLNNPQYDLTTANHTVPLKDNKIVLMNSRVQQTSESSRMYIYDLTGTNPPEYFTGTLFHNISNDTSDLLNIRFDEQIPIITLNKTLYSFWINGKDIGVNKDGVELAPLIGADISGENAVLNTGITSYEHTFYDYAGMYIYKSGILSIENTPDGDITYSWTPRDLSFIFDGKDFYDFYVQFSVRNEKVYYFSSLEKTIKVAAPKIDDAYSICFNGADYGASTIWMVGDTIYFTKYESATSVSTYRLNSNETNPTKVSSSDVAMQSITELTF